MDSKFDYSSIPAGHYDAVMRDGHPVRKMWHKLKFQRIIECLPSHNAGSILDIGCFAGSFLSLIDENRFQTQLGIDILPNQIEYANRIYGNSFRKFQMIDDLRAIGKIQQKFDFVTLIEVIEHLSQKEIAELFRSIDSILKPQGTLLLSTPNYTSPWPLIEILVNQLSDISYEEQHLTKFNYFTIESRLKKIIPDFSRDFRVTFKSSSHFISPFLAAISETWANKLDAHFDHKNLRFPFGNLILLALQRKT